MIIGLEWNQADDVTQWIEVASYNYSYLVDDGGIIKKSTMDGLEVIDGELNKELFETHGVGDLGEIIGRINKSADMIYQEDLDNKKLYGHRLVGYKNTTITSDLNSLIKTKDGKYYTYQEEGFIEIAPLTEDAFINQPIDFIAFNKTMNRQSLAVEEESVAGGGKSYSAKVRPSDWNRRIIGIDIT